jgi:hypothetical protein
MRQFDQPKSNGKQKKNSAKDLNTEIDDDNPDDGDNTDDNDNTDNDDDDDPGMLEDGEGEEDPALFDGRAEMMSEEVEVLEASVKPVQLVLHKVRLQSNPWIHY